MTKTKDDDLRSGSNERCFLYDARMNTMLDKNAEVPKNALKNIDPNMGLSQMAFQSALDNRQKDLQEVFFSDSYNIATNRFKLKDHKPSKHPTPVA